MCCKVYRENQREVEKCTTSIVCVSYESDFSKTSISKFQFDQESGRRRTTLWMYYLQIIIIYYYIMIYN